DHPKAGYREIITEYRVLQQQNGLCLAEITLHTGRTHQIRAHMAHIHAPLAGDSKYGDRRKNESLHLKHQLLCAYQLQFHPEADSCLAYLNGKTVTAPLPDFVSRFFPTFSSKNRK
ncbi:MAG: pseudouridine synthase, partial [Ruminococcus sp.]|nr:pseudouridine synthase [Ruminococcus sp.]